MCNCFSYVSLIKLERGGNYLNICVEKNYHTSFEFSEYKFPTETSFEIDFQSPENMLWLIGGA